MCNLPLQGIIPQTSLAANEYTASISRCYDGHQQSIPQGSEKILFRAKNPCHRPLVEQAVCAVRDGMGLFRLSLGKGGTTITNPDPSFSLHFGNDVPALLCSARLPTDCITMIGYRRCDGLTRMTESTKPDMRVVLQSGVPKWLSRIRRRETVTPASLALEPEKRKEEPAHGGGLCACRTLVNFEVQSPPMDYSALAMFNAEFRWRPTKFYC